MSPHHISKGLAVLFISLLSLSPAIAQCTVNGSGTIDFTDIVCSETGSAPVSGDIIIIPSGVTVTTEGNSQDLGTFDIRIESGGTFEIDHNNVDLDGNVIVESGGTFQINGKLLMSCGSAVSLEDGGTIITGSSSGASDRLSICGKTIIQGGGVCSDADGSQDSSPPYCAGSGITIETSFDETGEAPGILPIVLLSFTGEDRPEGVVIEWKTAIEERNAYFILENSRDGQTFTQVDQIEGVGNSTSLQHYSYLHSSPLSGVSYYRLVQVDTDETRTIYGPIRVDRTYLGELSVFPNPIQSGQLLTVRRSTFDEGEVTISMMDLQGRVIMNWKMTDTSSMQMTIPGTLDKGIYLLEISGGGKKKLHRLVLQ